PVTALWRESAPATRRLGRATSPVTGARLPIHHWSAPTAGAPSPVVLLLDGEVWHRQFAIAAELDRRVARGEVPPLHLLFLDSGGPKQREFDYASSPDESGALLASVREVATRGGVPDSPWIVAGQSMGGLFAMLAAVRHPHLVRAAVAQSPSLWWPSSPDPWQHESGWFEECGAALAARAHIAPLLLQAGELDDDVATRCRAAAVLLRSHGRLLGYDEHPGGHDVLQWQADLADALSTVLSSA
ncbi:alpha/beta hydrolase, partial [Microbacterium sp.]|uniref:alpha/beta hydrolase n=1 Tax=Microbacterium sp. TaxID=51671 RepID=UPI003C785B33